MRRVNTVNPLINQSSMAHSLTLYLQCIDMILGNNTGKTDNGIWDLFDPKLSSYAVPTVVVSAIGGG